MESLAKILLGFIGGIAAAAIGLYSDLLQIENEKRTVDLEVMKFAFNVYGSSPEDTGIPIRVWACRLINSVATASLASLDCDDENITRAIIPTGALIGTVVEGDPRRTDFDVFMCDQKDEKLAENVVEKLEASNVGNIRISLWNKFEEYSMDELKGKTTVIVDASHPEVGELPQLKKLIGAIPNIPQIVEAPNKGPVTRWRISVVLCP
jgi:hypothetical protein